MTKQMWNNQIRLDVEENGTCEFLKAQGQTFAPLHNDLLVIAYTAQILQYTESTTLGNAGSVKV